MTRCVYPGTFNPPTIGHVAIIEAVLDVHAPGRLDLMVSRQPLGKSQIDYPTLDHRLEILAASVAHLEVVQVGVTDLRLIADIAEGYDLVVMGADKWAQINDVAFYADEAARDSAVAALPTLAIVARGSDAVPDGSALEVGRDISSVSSSAARLGEADLMTPAAREFDHRTGAWSAPSRYEQFLNR